jgi:putative transposase
MPRKPLIRNSIYPYHVTARSNNKEWFDLPMKQVWNICLNSIKHANSRHPVDVISFVLMSNHYHLLVKTPDENLDLFMYELNKMISLSMRVKTKRVNKIFGGRYKWCMIQSNRYFANCYRYVYQNPMRANLVDRCEEYPYSTLSYKHSTKKFSVQLFDKLGFADEYKMSWINQPIQENEKEAIQSGLYRTVLSSLRDSKTKFLI